MATKLLLVEDVENLGRSGDVVNVKPGYARNFLLPQGVALTANKNVLRLQTKLQEERQKRAIEDKKEADQHASAIEGMVLTAIVKVDQEGHMYGSVSAADILALLEEKARLTLEKRAIQMKHPIRVLGDQRIAVRLKEGVKATVLLRVLTEEQANAPEATPEAAPEQA